MYFRVVSTFYSDGRREAVVDDTPYEVKGCYDFESFGGYSVYTDWFKSVDDACRFARDINRFSKHVGL